MVHVFQEGSGLTVKAGACLFSRSTQPSSTVNGGLFSVPQSCFDAISLSCIQVEDSHKHGEHVKGFLLWFLNVPIGCQRYVFELMLFIENCSSFWFKPEDDTGDTPVGSGRMVPPL